MEDEFLPYLDQWEQSVMEREGFSKTQQNKMPCPQISAICKLSNSYSNMKVFGNVIFVIAILAKQNW